MDSPRFLVFYVAIGTAALAVFKSLYLTLIGIDFSREQSILGIAALICTLLIPYIVEWAMVPVHEAAARAIAEAKRMRKRMLARRATYRRNARMRRAGGFCDDLARAHRRALYGGLCWVCAQPGTQMDHVIAIARGGTNWPANLRPICPRCNQSKGAKDWRPVSTRAAGLPRPAWLP